MPAADKTLTQSLVTRAKEITARELQVYAERTKGSQAANARARKEEVSEKLFLERIKTSANELPWFTICL